MTDDEIKYKLGESLKKEGWDMIVGSSLAYDKSIISLSTVSLGFIFAVSKKHPEIATPCKSNLILILILLILTITCSLLSFWLDQMFGKSLRSQAKQYCRSKEKEFKLKKDWSYYAAMWSKALSGIFFIISLVLYTIYFCNTYL